MFLHAVDGTLRSGFDLAVPHIRYGSDEHRLDSVVAEAGFLGPQALTPAAGARLVRLAFGVSLVPGLLEAPPPAGELPG